MAGGNTLFPGIQERLAKEMSSRETDPNNWTVRVVADPERREAVWVGGSILASLSTFKDESISREGHFLISRFLLEFSFIGRDDYLEQGSNVVNVKEEEREAAWKARIIDREKEGERGQFYL